MNKILNGVNQILDGLREQGISRDDISDGYHTFDELYFHRLILFAVICNQNKEISWKSKLHHDGTMFEGYFIVGVNTPKGQYTYHYSQNFWNCFDVRELESAPEYDGHKPTDVERLLSILRV